MPSHAIASRIPCTHSGRLRAASVSSIRSTIVPPDCRANTQLNSTDRAFPTWNIPVGEGAKRTRTAEWTMVPPYRGRRPVTDAIPAPQGRRAPPGDLSSGRYALGSVVRRHRLHLLDDEADRLG